MKVVIEGAIVQGLGVASGSLQYHLPLIIKHYADVRHCHRGTINVQLAKPLRVNNPDYTTQDSEWKSSGEVFSFLHIKFECPASTPSLDAWICIPHNSPHRPNLFMAEIITEKLPPNLVQVGTRCRIHIEKKHTREKVIVV